MPSTNSTLACANAATIAWVTGISVLIGGVAIDGNSFLALRIPSAAEGGQTLAVVWRRRRRTAIIGTRDDRPPGRDPSGGSRASTRRGRGTVGVCAGCLAGRASASLRPVRLPIGPDLWAPDGPQPARVRPAARRDRGRRRAHLAGVD